MAHGGVTGRGRAGRDADRTVRPEASLVPPKASKTRLLNDSPEARTSEILFVESKTRTHHGPVGSGRRTAGWRGRTGLSKKGRRWVDPARRRPFLLPSSESRTLPSTFLRKHEQAKSYSSNPKPGHTTGRSGRGGARRGGGAALG